ncbi:hypothetical protein Tco_1203696 [Tanacetum coccineum]
MHAEPFPEEDLEEKLNRWVKKEFKMFNEEARLSIQHWKESWHKTFYKVNQRKVKPNPEELFFDHKITEVVRIQSEDQRGLDFIWKIIVMRENDRPDSFSKTDFKYLNKNDIEDLYYLCLNMKVDFRIESYQIKINLTAPRLSFPEIEAHDLFTIIDEPLTGLIYPNSKGEKRVMHLSEISKFCDATLEKVLQEVGMMMYRSEVQKIPPRFGELNLDIMKAYKREIQKRLQHISQMRRWKSFVNERPILRAIRRP